MQDPYLIECKARLQDLEREAKSYRGTGKPWSANRARSAAIGAAFLAAALLVPWAIVA